MAPEHVPALDTDEARSRAIRAAAGAALQFVEPIELLGVGTGTTIDVFIELLATSPHRPEAAVASSVRTAHRLQAAGIEVVPPPDSGRLVRYIDGADEVDPRLRLIKGGGGAHSREKVLASASDTFICIVDGSKIVQSLGRRPVPVEVLPFARAFVARELRAMGAHVVERPGFVTDNGNAVLDATGLDLTDPGATERSVDCIAGVVACGIFGLRRPDLVIVGHPDGTVDHLRPPVA